LPYPELLRALKMPSLFHHRKQGNMIYVFQIIHGGVELDPDSFSPQQHPE